jgi:hypothetical protein
LIFFFLILDLFFQLCFNVMKLLFLLKIQFSVSGFEAGGQNDPSNIHPWTIIGDKSLILVSIDQTSCFERNKHALKMEVHCDNSYSCPPDGVGISNPGFWGMVRFHFSYHIHVLQFIFSLFLFFHHMSTESLKKLVWNIRLSHIMSHFILCMYRKRKI